MYFYRILDVLKEDFPATLAVLGADNFHNLVTGYLIEYPPQHFSISYAGNHSRTICAIIRCARNFRFWRISLGWSAH